MIVTRTGVAVKMELKGAVGKQGEEEKKHHDGSFHKYMEGKIQKLDVQFRHQSSMVAPSEADPVLRKLFTGVSIHVNGYTEPSHSALKQMMAQYGGSFQNYYSRSTVTHIICSNLPDAKVKQFEKERDPTPIVRPQWVTESIRARRLLPINTFILCRLRPGGPGQQTLADALRKGKASSVQYDENRLAQAQVVAQKLRQNCEVLKGPPKSSRDDPNFVESFYRASRLHFIGTWKTRVESLMESGIAEQAPTPSKPDPGHERAIIHVDMVR